ncbi:MAG: SirB1 family protein [Actinomycetota bacterium]
MSAASRERLRRLVRRPNADPAEAALLCCAEVEPHLDVDAALLRFDALADRLRGDGLTGDQPRSAATELAHELAGQQGFCGDPGHAGDPDHGLLTRVLETKRGLPITLGIVYVAVARRLAVPAFLVNLPGHVVVGVGDDSPPVLIDAFNAGQLLDEQAAAHRVEQTTGGRLPFKRAMLRPAPTAMVVRRLLNNLTRDFEHADRLDDALWTVELKLLLPNQHPNDHRELGRLLHGLGRYDEAARAYEAFLAATSDEAPGREQARRAAVDARARMN